MLTPSYALTATERVLPRLAIDFTTGIADPRVVTTRSANTGTRFNSSGLIELVDANLPRFDHSPTSLVCLGQLFEESRTNLFLNSLINGTNLSSQSVTLSAISYVLSFYGSGSIVISGGHSATVAGLGNFPNRVVYIFTPTAGSSTFTVSGDVKFAQLEAGAFVTSFIPTGATSVVRNSDIAAITGTNFSSWYNASEGALMAEFSFAQDTLKFAVSISDGTNNNRMQILCSSSRQGSIITSNVVQINFDNGNVVAGSTIKVAMAYKTDNGALSLNGAAPSTDNTIILPTVDRLYFGNATNGTDTVNGHVKKFLYWPQRIINNEVQAFSK